MEDKDIQKYARLMRELDLTGLEISENGNRIRLERGGQMQQAYPQTGETFTAPEKSEEQPIAIYNEIISPMVGVFYCAPAEDAEPFVKVGDAVRKGDVLCIIEAMKLMNEIIAEQDGVIAEVCVGNGQVVDYGRILFRMKKE